MPIQQTKSVESKSDYYPAWDWGKLIAISSEREILAFDIDEFTNSFQQRAMDGILARAYFNDKQ